MPWQLPPASGWVVPPEVTATPDASSTRLWTAPVRGRLFTSGAEHPRSRRPTDVVLLALSAGALVLLTQGSAPPSGFETALVALAAAVPSFLRVVWLLGAGAMTVWGLVLVVGAVARARGDLVRDHVVSLAATAGIVALLEHTIAPGHSWHLWTAVTATGPPLQAVAVRVALVATASVVSSPYIGRPYRTIGRWLVGLGAVSLVVLGATTPSGALIGVCAGAASAAAVHLLFGSSGGRPSLADVQRGLRELGVQVADLSEARRQQAGVFALDAQDQDGRPLLVKVYGRDAWDAQLLAKAWRALWYRDAEALTLTRLQQAEHEGFTTLLAARNGVPVHDVVRAGRTTGGDAILVLRLRGQQLAADPEHPALDEPTLAAVWDSALALGEAGFVHGDLGPSHLWLDDGAIVLDGLGGAAVAPTGDQRRIDRAQLLVTSALLAGIDRAVAIAQERLGTDGLAEVIPYLQKAAVGPRLRADLEAADLDLDELRDHTAASAGVDEPRLAKLRRVSAGTLVQAGLLAGAAYLLISALAGIDLAELADALRGASPAVLLLALVLAQTPRLAQAESTRGACPRPIAFGPLVLLQFAITFVNLVVPSTAARVAVSIRFFQRQGIPPASAVSIGVIDGFGGFVVQLLILGSVVLFGLGDVQLDLDLASRGDVGGLLRLLLGLVVAVVVVALGALCVPKARHWALDRIRPWIHEALETLSSLRSPSKVARILGGNLAAEVLFASTLALVLAAFGVSLPLATLLVINVSVALFAGLMPVPGGIGVAEGALVLGLTSAGVDQATAFAVVIAYRICTFYLPPVWGGIAFRRLERTGLL